MIFGSAYCTLCRERTVILRGSVLKRERDRAKEGGEIGGGLIVNLEKGERVGSRGGWGTEGTGTEGTGTAGT